MKTYGEWRYSSTILELGIKWRWVVSFTSRPLYFKERTTGTHWIGGLIGPRASLDIAEYRKSLSLASYRTPGRPASVQSLYRLSYFSSFGGYGAIFFLDGDSFRNLGVHLPDYTVEKRNISCPCLESNPIHPTRSSSLYQLSYPSSVLYFKFCPNFEIYFSKHLITPEKEFYILC
jgi:hypothetical protein